MAKCFFTRENLYKIATMVDIAQRVEQIIDKTEKKKSSLEQISRFDETIKLLGNLDKTKETSYSLPLTDTLGKRTFSRLNLMRNVCLIFIIILSINACNKDDCGKLNSSNSGIIISSFTPSNECARLDEYNETYIIRTQQEYDSLKIINRNEDTCTVLKLNPVDFEKYSLLGFEGCGNCQVAFRRKVTENASLKKYIFSLKVLECGDCKKLSCAWNWVLVPKLPDNWTVDFIEEE